MTRVLYIERLPLWQQSLIGLVVMVVLAAILLQYTGKLLSPDRTWFDLTIVGAYFACAGVILRMSNIRRRSLKRKAIELVLFIPFVIALIWGLKSS